MHLDQQAVMVVELWNVFADAIPAKKKKDCAYSFFKQLEEFDIFVGDLQAQIEGECDYLDEVLIEYLGQEEELEEDEE